MRPHARSTLGGRIALAAVLALAGGVYLSHLPHTVQALDTGELVGAAWARTVPHPPGFPLYVWLQFAFTHGVALGAVFWRAALFTTLCALGTLAALWWTCPTPLFAFTGLVPLALSTLFVRYAVLPDVFMLHALVTAVVVAAYLGPSGPKRTTVLFLGFGLGCANHPTTIFLLPLLLHAAIEARSIGAIAKGAALATGAVVALYGSLLLLDTHSIYSWGELHSASDVLWHALRRDYGTFQLSGHGGAADAGANLALLSTTLVEDIPLALLLALAPLALRFADSGEGTKTAVLAATVALYAALFLARANAPEHEILERFFVMPLVLVTVLAGRGLAALGARVNAPLAVLMSMAGTSLAASQLALHQAETDFSSDTVVAEYAQNLLAMAPGGKPTVVIVTGDTRCNALRYEQAVERHSPEAVVLCTGTIFDVARANKVTERWPDFHFDLSWKADVGGDRSILKHLVAPNLEKYDFLFTSNVSPPDALTTYLALGRRVSKGFGTELDASSFDRLQRPTPPREERPWSTYDESRALYAEYAYFFLKAGLQARDPREALAAFKRALEQVPYCYPAWKNICTLEKQAGQDAGPCEAALAESAASHFNYY